MNDTDDIDITLGPAEGTGAETPAVPSVETTAVEPVPEVWLSREVEEFIERFAAEDTSRERGGVLLGGLTNADGKPVLKIEKAIPAKHTKASAAHVTFTHETWQEIEEERARVAPDLKIVGWFHTHPGFGIFLSSMDQFIQRHFFNLPWQVAYVVDPVRGQRGFFRWSDGKAVPVEHKTYGTEGLTALTSVTPTRLEEQYGTQPSPKPGSKLNAIACIAAGLLVGFAAGYYLARPTIKSPPRVVREKVRYVTQPPSQELPQEETYQFYTVQPGDTLSGIARSKLGDERRWPEIRCVEVPNNPDLIRPGQLLVIPSTGQQNGGNSR